MPTIAVIVLCSIGAIEIDSQGQAVPPPPPMWRIIQDALPPALFYFVGGGILMGAAALHLRNQHEISAHR